MSNDTTIGVEHFPALFGEAMATTLSPATEPDDPPLCIRTREQRLIDAAMRETGGKVTAAARLLEISRATLYWCLKD